MTLSRLAAWRLGPEPTAENLTQEETTCRSKYHPFLLLLYIYIYIYIYITNFVLFNIGLATMKENKGKDIASVTKGEEDVQVLDDATPLVLQKPGI